jgi:NAD(P)H-hydrate epimerase
MFGAAVLASTAAARVGAGYVYLMTDTENFLFKNHPDFILLPRSYRKFSDFSAIAIGPALGLTAESLGILRALIRAAPENAVVDADALTLLAKHNISKVPATWVLTPHEGELARLLKISSAKIRADRRAAVKKAHEKFGCVVLLKGAGTLIASENGTEKVNAGNAALAKAGTGDVLTGLIAGLMSQQLTSKDAAKLATLIHGAAADLWNKKKDHLSLMASDLLELIPEAIKKMRR